MKFAALFAAVYAAFFYLTSFRDVQRIETFQAITRAPGFAPATVDEVEKFVNKNKSVTYVVRYRYEVNRRPYELKSNSIDAHLLRQFTEEPVEVAYDATHPSVATLRHYYDFRDKTETLAWTLFGRGIVSFLLALPLSLALGGSMGWLRRERKSEAPRHGGTVPSP